LFVEGDVARELIYPASIGPGALEGEGWSGCLGRSEVWHSEVDRLFPEENAFPFEPLIRNG
jgi:hypothetical protein